MNNKTNSTLNKYLNALFFILTVLYPVILYFIYTHFGLDTAVIVLCTLFVLKLIMKPSKNQLLVTIGLITLLALSYFLKKVEIVKFYPVLVNLILFATFFLSLKRKPIVQIFAEKFERRKLYTVEINYTRSVTIVWSLFFLFNSIVSLGTVYYLDFKHWTLYNGFISYLLVGIIFIAEYCTRMYLKSKWAKQNVK